MLNLGVNADREAMSDLDVPPSLLRELLEELLGSRPVSRARSTMRR
jgi:hypothetical protein